MSAAHWSDALPYRPCADALAWLRTQPDAETAWRTCERGNWMLFHVGKYAGESGSDARRTLVLAACACARLALPHVRAGESRPLRAIETAEAWARGDDGVTLANVRSAAAAAAAFAAAADASAAAAEAASAAIAKVQRDYADIARQHYPRVPR
jgi:hypothetical protein